MAKKRFSTMMISEWMTEDLSEHMGHRFGHLLSESFMLMLIALLFPFALGLEQGGMIALFLVSASLMRRIQQLLDENRNNIWVKQRGSWRSNRISAMSVLAMFIGLFLANILFASVLVAIGAEQRMKHFFDFVLKTEHLHAGQVLSARFSSFGAILANNYIVLLTTYLLAFLYRAFGMVLVICWNACVWAVVLFSVFRMAWLHTKVSFFSFFGRAVGAMVPHLLLEALAYILAALAAIFLSQGFSKYEATDKRFQLVFRASFWIGLFACLMVLLAAGAEALLPAWLLKGM